MTKNVEAVKDKSLQVDVDSKEIRDAAGDLSTLAERLSLLVAQFELSEAPEIEHSASGVGDVPEGSSSISFLDRIGAAAIQPT